MKIRWMQLVWSKISQSFSKWHPEDNIVFYNKVFGESAIIFYDIFILFLVYPIMMLYWILQIKYLTVVLWYLKYSININTCLLLQIPYQKKLGSLDIMFWSRRLKISHALSNQARFPNTLLSPYKNHFGI